MTMQLYIIERVVQQLNNVCVYICVCLHIQDHDEFVVQMLNGIGDYIDLRHALFPYLRLRFRSMSLQQMKQYIVLNGHCSALVKVLCLFLFLL